jgi:hypothetical protein
MTGAAFGRQLQCEYDSHSYPLRPSYKRCSTSQVDYSARFESEKHSFSDSSAQKSDVKAFEIWDSTQVDFIPLDILTEFPNLNGLGLCECNLPTLKSKLFKKELQKIEFLYLGLNKIEVIEAEAFQYLVKLKWIRLTDNKLQSLPYRLFVNNPGLNYINFSSNKINSIHPSVFDGLQKLKWLNFNYNLCINDEIGCETCQITQSELNKNLQECFENCQNDPICLNSHSAQETSEAPKVIPKTTESPLEIETTEIVTQKSEEIEEPQTEDPSQSSTAEPETEPLDLKLVLEGIDEKLLSMTEDLRVALSTKNESENKAIKNKIEETHKLSREILEKLNEINKINCGLESANELLTAQLENEKLKVKVLKAELGQKKMEKELKNLKRQSKGNLKENKAQN